MSSNAFWCPPPSRKKFGGVWYKLHAFTHKKSHAQTIRNQLKNNRWCVYTFGGPRI